MPHEYTRQRQGRDFSILNYLANAEMDAECNYNNIDGIIGNNDPKGESVKKESLLENLEQLKTERNAAPVDGYEPPERGR